MSSEARDYAMARIGVATAAAEEARESLTACMQIFIDASDDTDGKVRSSLLEDAELALRVSLEAVAKANAADLDDDDLAAGEFDDDDDPDDDDDGDGEAD